MLNPRSAPKVPLDVLRKRPPEFEAVFLAEGWRGIERYFGARTAVNRAWLEECGGVKPMQARRRQYLRALHDGPKTRRDNPAICSSKGRDLPC